MELLIYMGLCICRIFYLFIPSRLVELSHLVQSQATSFDYIYLYTYL